ncbi:hypothetical protein BJ170DRAFT_593641 [Xylariales sp. AK1849]|nr:hypothetical protein BJ170DRAFT_593641 [Xylariales sp. AK1849]
MASSEGLMQKLADTLVTKHDLDGAAILALASAIEEDDLRAKIAEAKAMAVKGSFRPKRVTMSGTNEVGMPYPELVALLSDINKPFPDWLGVSESGLRQYTDDEMDTIVNLIELRFWHGTTDRHLLRLWPWEIVFGQPRIFHRLTMHRLDAKDFDCLKGPHGYYSWLCSFPSIYYEDFPASYTRLREMYFPTGIDDAIDGFTKHYRQVKHAIRKLRKRCSLVEEKGIDENNSTVLVDSHKVLAETEVYVETVMRMAQRWNRDTKRQRAYFMLPGVSLGLQYGEVVYVDYDLQGAYVNHKMENGSTHWDEHGEVHTPVRWKPGSVWRDWYHNVSQPQPILERHTNEKDRGPQPFKITRGPYEVRLPQAVEQMEGSERTKAERRKQGRAISRATGEHYWRLRPVECTTATIEMMFPTNPSLDGRPRYDGLGNLRYPYMGVVIGEINTGKRVRDHRAKQSVLVMKGLD